MSSSSNNTVISLAGVSVRYRVPTEQVATLKEYVIRMLRGRRIEYRALWALDGLNLDIRRGESLGIIGRNGAGKSTLLKVIARVLRPTQGRVWVRGNVAPLIELGAGFHLELTGRENVFLNGALLGFSQAQMQERFDRIVAFAELGSFIDAALRSYSSGMVLRLGFAVATEIEPDILIIDEVLAVGDESFREKCLARMKEFRERGTTILFVSHALETVRSNCDRAVWIDGGKIRQAGPVEQVIDAYRSYMAHPAPAPSPGSAG
jgi:ABC-2 type transport system ATP-binding protein/lipopolysaccharide transport system ATP-binding protein